MNWPKEYLAKIHSGEIVAGTRIRKLYEREVGWMDNPPKDFPFYFDEEAGQRPIDFIEKFCRHSKGKWARELIKLDLFQKAKLQLVFSWLEKDTGKRRVRQVIDVRGRKNGKSTETAAVELFMLIADGEEGAGVFACANKLDQSKLVFDEAVNMRAQSPALRAITRKRQSDIYFPATFSKLQALAADTRTLDGLNSSMFSFDEFHEARDSKIYDVMLQSQSSREQPLAWLISTNGFVRELFFDNIFNYCEHVALWDEGFEDYRTIPFLYVLDSLNEWTDPKCWEKANPSLGRAKSIQTLVDNVEKAKRDHTFLPTLLVKDFCLPENSNTQWLPYEAAVNETDVPIEYLRNTYAIGGADLSSTTDLTSCCLLIRKPEDPNFYVLSHFFLPQSRIDATEQTNSREAPYLMWAEQGWLTICEGATVDYRAVTQWFVDMVGKHSIRPLWICYDRALAGYWQNEMTDNGFDMVKIPQGPFVWSYPLKRLGGLFEEHRIVYQNNPVLRWNILNTGIKTLNREGIQTIQPVKTSSSRRIDGLVALLNAFVGYCDHEEDFLRYCRIKE